MSYDRTEDAQIGRLIAVVTVFIAIPVFAGIGILATVYLLWSLL